MDLENLVRWDDCPYEKIRYLNKGAFGNVVLASRRSNNTWYALKFIEPSSVPDSKYLEREIINHYNMHHDHIIKLDEVTLIDGHLVLVLEYAKHGSLAELVRHQDGLSESDARSIFNQIVLAVDYCHQLGVCIRDIKLENVLLTGDRNSSKDNVKSLRVKVCDFGFSKHKDHHSLPKSVVGTEPYLAPEVISRNGHGYYDGQAADVWSLGVLLYVMVVGRFPFGSGRRKSIEDKRLLYERILSGNYEIPQIVRGRPLSESFRDLVSRMLIGDFRRRLKVSDVINHHWFKEGLCESQHREMIRYNRDQVANSLRASNASPEVQMKIQQLIHMAGFRTREREEAGLNRYMGNEAERSNFHSAQTNLPII